MEGVGAAQSGAGGHRRRIISGRPRRSGVAAAARRGRTAARCRGRCHRLLLAVLISACAAGCQSPFLLFSGKGLDGRVAETDSFAFASDYTLLKLEVRPERPYSVFLRVVTRDGELYIDAAEKRRWHTYLKEDPNIRVQLGDTIYLARAVKVDDPDITATFLSGRTIYRIEPRALEND